MGIFLIGYDVEAGTPGDHEAKLKTPAQLEANTLKFMDRASELHAQYQIPATLFITGSLLERVPGPFKKHLNNPWLDFQQHTYNHTSLKPAVVTHNGRVELFNWPTAKDNDEVRWELRTTNEVFKRELGIACRGLSTPFAYYMGLADRPDILKVLHEEGIRYIRCFHLNKEELAIREALPFDYHPFNHATQGYPDIIDFCIKGYSDITWAQRYGWGTADGYVSYVKQALHQIEKSDNIWTWVVHDWALLKINDRLSVIEEILAYVKKLDIEVLSFEQAYEKLFDDPRVTKNEGRKVDWKVDFVRSL